MAGEPDIAGAVERLAGRVPIIGVHSERVAMMADLRLLTARLVTLERERDEWRDEARGHVETIRQAVHVRKTLEREHERLRLKNEQYAKQLDDRWAGVVAQVNAAIAENARLRALLPPP